MTGDAELRRAFGRLADESVGPAPVGPGDARNAAHGAIRRARRRFTVRVAVPIVALLAVGGVAGVSLRSPSGTNEVRTAGAGHPPPGAAAGPSSAAGGLGRTPGRTEPAGEALADPVTVDGWTITRVPAGTSTSTVALTSTIADFGPEGATCAGKPAAAVTVLANRTLTIDSLLSGSTAAGPNVPVPMAGTTGVEEVAGSQADCPSEVFTFYQPRPGIIIQIATTASGVAGAQVIAAGIQAAG